MLVRARLGTDDLPEIETAAGHQYTDQGKAHGNLIGDDLGGGPHGAEERIFGVGGPACNDDAINAE